MPGTLSFATIVSVLYLSAFISCKQLPSVWKGEKPVRLLQGAVDIEDASSIDRSTKIGIVVVLVAIGAGIVLGLLLGVALYFLIHRGLPVLQLYVRAYKARKAARAPVDLEAAVAEEDSVMEDTLEVPSVETVVPAEDNEAVPEVVEEQAAAVTEEETVAVDEKPVAVDIPAEEVEEPAEIMDDEEHAIEEPTEEEVKEADTEPMDEPSEAED
ncbi:hypothetical protein J8273_6882 [Carpediemonas membranifera]|uniref:Uncharacterized protein n=1 Tax=Carpediemonas membranifera TaxID=201153 RepID=A0A8J6DYA6_9EUKA|nr:hypothetical protein J8273_6882 [Carpediemonas membranifera]|eukprot:KAG9391869.1 hypothetical protein J8273_6882 [Carpediemonas membranifera]